MVKGKLPRTTQALLLCLLITASICDTQHITGSTNATFAKLDASIQNILQISGSIGIAVVNLKFRHSNSTVTFECNTLKKAWCLMPRVAKHSNDSLFDVNVECGVNTCELDVELLSDKSLSYDPADGYLQLISPEGVQNSTITFEINSASLFTKDIDPKTIKLRFLMSGGDRDKYLPGYFEGHSVFKMEVFYKTANQSSTDAKSISRPVTELGSTIMATIYSDDVDFCMGNECSYIVKITASKVPLILFEVQAIDTIKSVNVSGDFGAAFTSIWLDGQTFIDRPDRYEFKMNNSGDLTFELVAWDGNPDIYANIDDNKSYKTENYYYKSAHDAPESIMISKQELEDSAEGGKVVHVVIESKIPSGYYLSATWSEFREFDKTTPIKPNSFYSGALHNNEVANFILTFTPQITEVISGYVILKSVTGNPDLYIKDCENDQNCYFTIDEINALVKSKQSNPNADDSYFIYSNDPLKNDNLFFELMVSPPGTVIPESEDPVSDDVYVSNVNKICIGVVGNKNAFSEMSQYSLMVSSKGSHKVIKEYQTEYFFMNQNDSMYCVFKPLKLPDQAKGIIISFAVSSGNVKFYYSKLSRYPSDLVNDDELFIDNDQTYYESTLARFKVDKNDLSNDGVYFGFVASQQTTIKLEVTYWLPQSKSSDGIIELIPNAPVVRNIKQVSEFIDPAREMDVFKFKTADVGDHLFIKMKPLFSGGYNDLIFCAGQMDGKSETVDAQNCKYTGTGGMISIEPSNENTDITWFVIVKHEKINEKQMEIRLAYEIVLLGPGTISPLRHMGMPEDFILPAGLGSGENIHYIEFISQSQRGEYYLMAQSLNNQPFRLTISFGQTGLDWNEGAFGMNIFSDSATSFLVPFKESDIRKNCQVMSSDEATDLNGNRRIIQDDLREVDDNPYDAQSNGKPHGEISMPLKCKGFIKISNSNINYDQEMPYRLTFSEINTKIELLAGRTYKLPKPGNHPLYMRVPIGSLKDGATISVSGIYEYSELSASVVSASLSDKTAIYNSSVSLASGFGSFSLDIDPSSYDSDELKRDNHENYIDVIYAVLHEDDDYERNDDGSLASLIVGEYFTVSVSTSTASLSIEQTATGRVTAGSTRYYSLTVDSSVDITLTLQTRGRQDADMFVKLKGRSENLVKSTNYRSDEVYLPRRSQERGQEITYIIGIVGSTPVCDFSLTAMDNSFKVVDPSFSKIYTFEVSEQSPVVLRSEWAYYGGIRLFYYSFDTDIAIKVGSEGKDGLIAAVKRSASETPISWNEEVGITARYVPNKGGLNDDWTGKFLAFYPFSTSEGSVSFVVNHPLIPIKITPGDAQLRIVLNKGENILIEPYVDHGELSLIQVGIGGAEGLTSFTYNTK